MSGFAVKSDKPVSSGKTNTLSTQRLNVMRCNVEARMAANSGGRDMLTTRLQGEIQTRRQDITLGTQMMRNINDSRSAILRNIR